MLIYQAGQASGACADGSNSPAIRLNRARIVRTCAAMCQADRPMRTIASPPAGFGSFVEIGKSLEISARTRAGESHRHVSAFGARGSWLLAADTGPAHHRSSSRRGSVESAFGCLQCGLQIWVLGQVRHTDTKSQDSRRRVDDTCIGSTRDEGGALLGELRFEGRTKHVR